MDPRKKIAIGVLALTGVTLPVASGRGGEVNLFGNWRYQESSDAEGGFGQRYLASWNHGVDLTRALHATTDVRYEKTLDPGEERDLVAPNLDFALRNDYFDATLGGSLSNTRYSEGEDTLNRSWRAALSSKFTKKYLPQLRLAYNESRDTSELQSETTRETEYRNLSLSADWDLEKIGTVHYSASRGETNDIIDDSEGENLSQRARFETSQSFFDNRFQVGFYQDFSKSDSQYTARADASGGKYLEIDAPSATVRDCIDAGTAFEVCSSNGALTNDLLTDYTASPVTPLDRYGVVVALGNQQVDAIHLYADEAVTSGWQLASTTETSVTPTTVWTVEPAPLVAYELDPAGDRLEFVLAAPITGKRFLRLILPPTARPSFGVAEVEALRFVLGTDGLVHTETDRTSYETGISLGYALSSTLQLSYSGAYQATDSSSSGDATRLSQTAGLGWSPKDYFSSRLSASETRDEQDQGEDLLSRAYSFSATVLPLATLDLTGSLTRSESYIDAELQSVQHTLGLAATARLYEDLDGTLALTYGTSDNEVSGLTQDSLNTDILFTARLSPRLTMTWRNNYATILTGDGGDSFRTGLTANWRPSSYFGLNSGFDYQWQESGQDAMLFRLSGSLQPTSTTQFNMSYGLNAADTTLHTLNSSLVWNLTRMFTFTTSGSYLMGDEEDIWTVALELAGRFSY